MTDKKTTRVCPNCGNGNLVLLRSLNLKACTDCYENDEPRLIPWHLDKDQAPLFGGPTPAQLEKAE